MAVRVYLKHAAPVDFPTGADVEPTLFPAPVGSDGRHALEVLDDARHVLACFQLAEVAGYAIDPPEGPERP